MAIESTPPTAVQPATPTTPQVGSSNWRSVVLRQAQRLTDELAAMPDEAVSAAPDALLGQVRERIDAARRIAEHAPRSWETLRNWWTGNAVETAWDHLQTAREDMFMFAPAASVRAQLPSIQRRLAKVSPDPAHDPQLAAIGEIAVTSGDLSLDQREEIRTGHEHVRMIEDDHSEARAFRNNLLLWSAGLTAVAIVLAAIQASGFDYLAVGAGAGMLTTALAWRNLTHVEGPYAVSTAQALLKVPAGAASALLGVVLVRSGMISGLNVNASTAYGYAVVFGLSQQALTQVVDNAAKKIAT
jgi:hypothetical protein